MQRMDWNRLYRQDFEDMCDDRLPSSPAAQCSSGHLPRPGRGTLRDLSTPHRGIENKDVNRLASLYQWNGISNASANRILNKLEAIVDRPLVDIAPVRPAPPPIFDEDGVVVDENSDGYYPQTAARQRPVGLRLEQTLKNGTTPSRTVFGLRRAYKCFWITL